MRPKASLLPLLVLLATSFAGCHGLSEATEAVGPSDLVPPPAIPSVDAGPETEPPVATLAVTLSGRNVTARLGLVDARPVSAWAVDWDDGTPATQGGAILPDHITHHYARDDTFTIKFLVETDDGHTVETTTNITLGDVQTDTAQRFVTAGPTSGAAPLHVTIHADVPAIVAADRRLPGINAPHKIAAWAIDFGDGTRGEAARFNPPDTLQHIYTRTGSFTLTFVVVMATGNAFTSFIEIDAYPPDDIEAWTLHTQPPQLRATDTSGATVRGLTLPDGGTCAACYRPVEMDAVEGRLAVLAMRADDAGILWVVDRASGREVGTWPIPEAPTSMRADPHGRVWIAHRDDPRVTVIDPEDGNRTRIEMGPLGENARFVFEETGSVGFAIQDGPQGVIAQLAPEPRQRSSLVLPSGGRTQALDYDEARRTLALLDAETGDVRLVRPGTQGPQLHGIVDLETGETSIPVSLACSSVDEGCFALHYEPVTGQGLVSTFLPSERLRTQRSDNATPVGLAPPGVRLEAGLRPVDLRLLEDGTLVIGTRDRDGLPWLVLLHRDDLNTTRKIALAPDGGSLAGTTVGLRVQQHPELTNILYWQDPVSATWGAVDLAVGKVLSRHATPSTVPLGFHITRAATSS